MTQQELNVITNGKYKNIELKAKPKRGIVGITPGSFILVEKTFIEGLAVPSRTYTKKVNGQDVPSISYSCKAKLGMLDGSFTEEVSFWLTEREHDLYKVCGGVGDVVKITLTKEPVLNQRTGNEELVQTLHFEKVE